MNASSENGMKKGKMRNRGLSLSQEKRMLLAMLRSAVIGTQEKAAETMGLGIRTVRRVEQHGIGENSTLHAYTGALFPKIGAPELLSANPPTFLECMARPPTALQVRELIDSHMQGLPVWRELIDLALRYPALCNNAAPGSSELLGKELRQWGRLLNEGGFYPESLRAFAAAASMFRNCRQSAAELACLIQCMIVSWTTNAPGVTKRVRRTFDRAFQLVADSRFGLTAIPVAHFLSGLACGTFHFFLPCTEGLLATSAELFQRADYECDPLALVDPRRATERRIIHFQGDTNWKAAYGALVENAKEDKRRGIEQGPGNTLFAAICLRQQHLAKGKLTQLIRVMQTHAATLANSSAWCREFYGLAWGRLLSKTNQVAEGEALVGKHLLRIKRLGFTPGRPMADRYPLFFSPEPCSEPEARLIKEVGAFRTRKEFPIPSKELSDLASIVKNRFSAA